MQEKFLKRQRMIMHSRQYQHFLFKWIGENMSIQLIAQHRLKAYYLTHTPNNRRKTHKRQNNTSQKKN